MLEYIYIYIYIYILEYIYIYIYIRIYEHFENFANFYIITELVSGGELMDRIIQANDDGNQISELWAAQVMHQILLAVMYCHSQKIIHKDLKPMNILLGGNEDCMKNPRIIKVIDFGIAEIFGKSERGVHSGGSPMFCAPEVFNQSFGPKCDIWSCGIVLFMLLTGRFPYSATKYRIVKLFIELWSKLLMTIINLLIVENLVNIEKKRKIIYI
eukprot:GHVL01037041.1.p1 GENE.GHVL01037041.1~~GHVL01037041.1.p1  ORF type:complete len:213 (+),score=37.94 GHVL01037041.1:192-830(+)